MSDPAKSLNERPLAAYGQGIYPVVELVPNGGRVLALDTSAAADSVAIPAGTVLLEMELSGRHYYTTDGSTPTGAATEHILPSSLSYHTVPLALIDAGFTLSMLAVDTGGAQRVGVYLGTT
jgi:hypothetical protein